MLREKNIPYEEVIRLEDKLPELDVLYMTRVQKERFFNEEDYVRLKDFYILTAKKMKLAPPDMLVLPVNRFAVLTDESQYETFAAQVNGEEAITTVYIVTDSEPGYREMVSGLHAEDTYQLYRDYLDNFRINTGR